MVACWPEHRVDDHFQVNRPTAMPGHGLAAAKIEKSSRFGATLRERKRRRWDGQNSYFPTPCRRVLAQAPRIYVSSSSLQPPPPCSVRMSVQRNQYKANNVRWLSDSVENAIDSFQGGGGREKGKEYKNVTKVKITTEPTKKKNNNKIIIYIVSELCTYLSPL